jgi:hypothetical protein
MPAVDDVEDVDPLEHVRMRLLAPFAGDADLVAGDRPALLSGMNTTSIAV